MQHFITFIGHLLVEKMLLFLCNNWKYTYNFQELLAKRGKFCHSCFLELLCKHKVPKSFQSILIINNLSGSFLLPAEAERCWAVCWNQRDSVKDLTSITHHFLLTSSLGSGFVVLFPSLQQSVGGFALTAISTPSCCCAQKTFPFPHN